MNDKYLSVSVINRYIKHVIDTDSNLQQVFIKGEISNFKAHSSGHLYFSIKDEMGMTNPSTKIKSNRFNLKTFSRTQNAL